MAIVDFHNHVMPGVDDGARDADEARVALEAFALARVAVVVATPHVNASTTLKADELQARLRELDTAFAELQRVATDVAGVEVRRGVELLLDVPDPDLADERLRLDRGTFVLMEFPFMTVPPFSERALGALRSRGVVPVVAHPERYRGINAEIEIAGRWRENGAFLQVNGGSLLGRYGAEARVAAFELLGRGWVDYLGSDYHARGAIRIAEYRSLLESLEAREQALTLMETNPARLLEGLPPLPVQPLRLKNTLWQRVAGLFGS